MQASKQVFSRNWHWQRTRAHLVIAASMGLERSYPQNMSNNVCARAVYGWKILSSVTVVLRWFGHAEPLAEEVTLAGQDEQ